MTAPSPQHVVVMGVAGCGKTTLGERLAAELGWVFAEGDRHHPPANIAKMAAGTPLEDADRWPWLESLAERIAALEAAGVSSILTCSALEPLGPEEDGVEIDVALDPQTQVRAALRGLGLPDPAAAR